MFPINIGKAVKNLDNKQLAHDYAIAKILGYDKSVNEFKEKYDQYYSETISELNSKPVEIAKVAPVKNPFRSTNYE